MFVSHFPFAPVEKIISAGFLVSRVTTQSGFGFSPIATFTIGSADQFFAVIRAISNTVLDPEDIILAISINKFPVTPVEQIGRDRTSFPTTDLVSRVGSQAVVGGSGIIARFARLPWGDVNVMITLRYRILLAQPSTAKVERMASIIPPTFYSTFFLSMCHKVRKIISCQFLIHSYVIEQIDPCSYLAKNAGKWYLKAKHERQRANSGFDFEIVFDEHHFQWVLRAQKYGEQKRLLEINEMKMI